MANNDVITLTGILQYRGPCIDRLHLFAVAVFDATGILFHRELDAIVHRLAPALVIDGVLNDERDLDHVAVSLFFGSALGENHRGYQRKHH